MEVLTELDDVGTVYNLRISDYHTYFVGNQDWGFSVRCITPIMPGSSIMALFIFEMLQDKSAAVHTKPEAALLESMADHTLRQLTNPPSFNSILTSR